MRQTAILPPIKGHDVIVLLKLIDDPSEWTVRSLAGDLGLAPAAVHRSLTRLSAANLFDPRRRRVSLSLAEEFLVHAVKFLFPPIVGGEGRGVATAWGAEPLRSELAPAEELPPVWPDPHGNTRGIILEPLHAVAPALAASHPRLAANLALLDAIRMGDARIRRVAAGLLTDQLSAAVAVG